MMEAKDLNEFFNQFIPSTSKDSIGRIKAHTASFCTERSGHFDAFDQRRAHAPQRTVLGIGDWIARRRGGVGGPAIVLRAQGITFFLPNGSWIQPPGYVHQMIHSTWLPEAVAVNTTRQLSCSAQRAKDGSQLRLLI
eukprot:gene5013-2182_t